MEKEFASSLALTNAMTVGSEKEGGVGQFKLLASDGRDLAFHEIGSGISALSATLEEYAL
jgi:hypothetical protein